MQVEYDDGRLQKILFADTMEDLLSKASEEIKDPHAVKITLTRPRLNPKKHPQARRKARRAAANGS